MVIVGLDVSSYIGVVMLDGETLVDQKSLHFKNDRGYRRITLLAGAVRGLLRDKAPALAMVEGYSMGAKGDARTMLVEIGAAVRLELFHAKIPWYEVPPSSLKAFAGCKGNAKKPVVAATVEARWGFTSFSDDIVDAYVLARMGQAVESGQTFKGVTPWI